MKVATILGARPQFIKAAAVSRIFAQQGVQEVLIHTGQHYDTWMSDVFFDELDIPRPAYQLDVGSGSHGQQTGRMLEALEGPLRESHPDYVLVYGDTNSTLAGALVAAKMHLPVVHIEAGLRSFNRRMPEEINRVACDHMSDLLFAPTRTAVEHLRNEGIYGEHVYLVGDVMYDATRYYLEQEPTQRTTLQDLQIEKGQYVLATIHRAENVDDPARLESIIDGLEKLSRRVSVVIPVHPRTRVASQRMGLFGRMQRNLRCIEPVGYLDMLQLEQSAQLIATDSGGVQKEAYFAGVPCLTLRNETEWTELVDEGWNRLVSSAELPALDEIAMQWTLAVNRAPQKRENLFGGGRASDVICGILKETYSGKQAA